jgi:hypothetical protein
MTQPTLDHIHWPVYRIVRASWRDPLDASYSQRPGQDSRWNADDFPALYCCCSIVVARAVTTDLFRIAGVLLGDLQPSHQPQLVEIQWQGTVADMVTSQGIAAAGFGDSYLRGADKRETRTRAALWHSNGMEGIVARSASLSRLGFDGWSGSHEPWGELAIYPDICGWKPQITRRRADLGWFSSFGSPP